MQSQQKRVKWSRGETAEALEERTDTGITNASVELMENCIPDIYGNISRRPALKLVPNGDFSQISGFEYDEYMQVFPFYITENDYILIGIHYNDEPEFIRIKDGIAVWYWDHEGSNYPKTSVEVSSGQYAYRPVSFAQQDNYMIISDGNATYKITFNIRSSALSQYYFDSNIEVWKFSAGWYAPNGTNTKEVSNTEITGLNFQSNHVGTDVYASPDGSTNVYTWIHTGISASGISATWSDSTTTFYFGITEDLLSYYVSTTPSAGDFGSWTMTNSSTYTDNTVLVSVTPFPEYPDIDYKVTLHITGTNAWFEVGPWGTPYSYNVGSSFSYILPPMEEYIPVGSIVHFPNNGGYMRVEGYDSDGTNLRMYGELLTPIADTNTSDTKVNIEYGYKSLQPSNWNGLLITPHPQKIVFAGQRLWAGDWAYSITQSYAITIGSQIARYTDFKNNYNQENEAITLDILTQYKERILHLVDYNGLKIMTDSYEYAYDGTNGVVKQSANGSFEYCEPIVFDSLCLYIDSTGQQVKAMQYEFQSNIFNSSTINQVAPHDLVWYPWNMAQYEDKYNSTGKYLFLVNREDANARLAVCNFVPSNQANIWSRWSLSTNITVSTQQKHIIHSVVNLKNCVIFMVRLPRVANAGSAPSHVDIVPAILDFNYNTDFEDSVYTKNGVNYFGNWVHNNPTGYFLTIPNAQVAVYANGVFQWLDTTTNTGALTKSIEGLNNVTVGLPINSTIRSHPIDVGGKTKSIKKRIGKARMSVHGTDAGVLTINGKTGYMNPAKDTISFYGVTGMKNEIKYTITNNNGGMFHLESLLMNIEYGTLDS